MPFHAVSTRYVDIAGRFSFQRDGFRWELTSQHFCHVLSHGTTSTFGTKLYVVREKYGTIR